MSSIDVFYRVLNIHSFVVLLPLMLPVMQWDQPNISFLFLFLLFSSVKKNVKDAERTDVAQAASKSCCAWDH
jgi:hypothetical protein